MEVRKIDIKAFENGTYNFDYRLDTEFFIQMQQQAENVDEAQRIISADVVAKVKLTVSDEYAAVHYSAEGSVSVPCDRCLAPVAIEIAARDDEMADGDTIDLPWLLYEQVVLGIPMTHVHPDGQCDSEMTDLLNKHLRNN